MGLGEKSLKDIKDAFTAFFYDRMADSFNSLTVEVEKLLGPRWMMANGLCGLFAMIWKRKFYRRTKV